MKVSDLMDDLETGDRTMEHLAKPAEPERQLSPAVAEIANQLSTLQAGNLMQYFAYQNLQQVPSTGLMGGNRSW
jgi:hypothetical protein